MDCGAYILGAKDFQGLERISGFAGLLLFQCCKICEVGRDVANENWIGRVIVGRCQDNPYEFRPANDSSVNLWVLCQ